MTIKDMVKDGKKVYLSHYHNGSLFYRTDDGFLFEVPLSDTGDAVFNREDKAILFMRWIRKQMKVNESGSAGMVDNAGLEPAAN